MDSEVQSAVCPTVIKEEDDVRKQEDSVPCVLCTDCTEDSFDVFRMTTLRGQVTLCSYIYKVSNTIINPQTCISTSTCRACYNLVNNVEEAEIEYVKYREVLLRIISQNATLRDNPVLTVPHDLKIEYCKEENGLMSDDEPLATVKNSRRSKKLNGELTGMITEADGKLSSDEDFYWSLDSKENEDDSCETLTMKKTFKKAKTLKRKKSIIKEESEQNPADMLVIQLKEELKYNWTVSELKKRSKSNHSYKEKKKQKQRIKKEQDDKSDLACPKCNKRFTRKTCFEHHLESHDNQRKPFICEVCGKAFKNRKMCDVHVRMHQGIADYKCIPCNKLFATKFAFLRHDKIHQGKPKHQCDLCGKSFIHTSSFRMHKLAHAGIKNHSCDVCGLALLSSSHLNRHKRIHSGEKRYECDFCSKKFSEKYNMQSHMRVHMKGKDLPPSPLELSGKRKRWFRCERCDEKFDRLFKLEIHLVDDHKVVLKKGRPKPRNTMKKLQRAQQAAASVVSALASAMVAKRGEADWSISRSQDVPPLVEVKPCITTETKEGSGARGPAFKTSPHHANIEHPSERLSPVMQASSSPLAAHKTLSVYQQHQQEVMRQASAVWPHMAYSNMGYLGRVPDYSQN